MFLFTVTSVSNVAIHARPCFFFLLVAYFFLNFCAFFGLFRIQEALLLLLAPRVLELIHFWLELAFLGPNFIQKKGDSACVFGFWMQILIDGKIGDHGCAYGFLFSCFYFVFCITSHKNVLVQIYWHSRYVTWRVLVESSDSMTCLCPRKKVHIFCQKISGFYC